MRQVTQRIKDAWDAGKSLTVGNTNTDGKSVWLHGNKIVRRDEDGTVWFTNAGWPTMTTHERLNGLLNQFGIAVCKHQHETHVCKVGNWREMQRLPADVADWFSVRMFV